MGSSTCPPSLLSCTPFPSGTFTLSATSLPGFAARKVILNLAKLCSFLYTVPLKPLTRGRQPGRQAWEVHFPEGESAVGRGNHAASSLTQAAQLPSLGVGWGLTRIMFRDWYRGWGRSSRSGSIKDPKFWKRSCFPNCGSCPAPGATSPVPEPFPSR